MNQSWTSVCAAFLTHPLLLTLIFLLRCTSSPTSDTCPSSGCLEKNASILACEEFYSSLPRRSAFFRRVAKPPGVDPEKFGFLLSRGGIHPRGVVLSNEFFELQIDLDSNRLQDEVRNLLGASGEEWERASTDNEEQGVVSKHFRLTESTSAHDSLEGPYREVDGRLARSPYIRSVLQALGGVVGNVALMNLEPGGFVDEHFDTSSYWIPRVRVHIPIWTNDDVIFSCGQRGEMHNLHMAIGRAYLFDNHLGHTVNNSGNTRRVHLTVDLVGGRKFWALVERSRSIGSSSKPASHPAFAIPLDENAQVAIESWSDRKLKGRKCSPKIKALAATAAQLGDESGGRELGEAWCAELKTLGKKRGSRKDEVNLLQQLATKRACSENHALLKLGSPISLVEIADSIAEVHRLDEADAELQIIGGEEVK